MLKNYETVARQLVRATRGRRSQAALSRRAGYRTNMVQRWEAGECFPTAARFFTICELQRIDVCGAIERFYGRPPSWLRCYEPGDPRAVVQLLSDQRGKIPFADLERRIGFNRYRLSRWLRGKSQPRLPDFLALLDACSHRLLDFIALLVSPDRVPSLKDAWQQLERARATAYDQPWSHAVLRVLELQDYQSGGFRRRGFITRKLGCEEVTVRRALEALTASGQVKRVRGRYVPTDVMTVNTGRDPARARALKGVWGRAALERLEQGHPGLFGYSVFAVSRDGLRAIRQLQLDYVRAMEALIADSADSECVGVYCVQLLDLDASKENALLAAPEAPSASQGSTP